MNEELQRQLAALLSHLLVLANDAGGWVEAQIPPLVQEKILYGRIQHTILGVLFAVAAWRAAVFVRRFYQQANAIRPEERHRFDIWPERPGGIPCVLSTVVCLGSVLLAVNHLEWAVMAWLTPRLFIVEWLLYLGKASL